MATIDLLTNDPRKNRGNVLSPEGQARVEAIAAEGKAGMNALSEGKTGVNALSLRHPEKAHRPDNPIQKKPDWIRVKAPGSPGWKETHRIVKENGLVTVCEEAGCPNLGECWDKKHATFMIMGDTCTRACAFCNIKTGMPAPLDPNEPEYVATATAKLGLAHVVVTSVDRDDLADGGAEHFAQTIRAIRKAAPSGAKLLVIELVVPDDPGPAWAKTLDIHMLTLLGGRQRRTSEYVALFERTGFTLGRQLVSPAGTSILEALPA